MSKQQIDALVFNQDDIVTLLAEIGYNSDNLTRDKDSTRILIDMGCNFVDEVLDYCKMMRIQTLKPEHIDAAVRMKFGKVNEKDDKKDKEIDRIKSKGIELQKID